jgi:hypothetical protein
MTYIVGLVKLEDKNFFLEKGWKIQSAKDQGLIGPDKFFSDHPDPPGHETVVVYIDRTLTDVLNCLPYK